MLIALVSVPFMLLPKPLILKKRHEKRAAQLEAYGRVSPTDADDEESNALHIAAPHGGHDEEEFDFSEVMVHQASTLPAHFRAVGPVCLGCYDCRAARRLRRGGVRLQGGHGAPGGHIRNPLHWQWVLRSRCLLYAGHSSQTGRAVRAHQHMCGGLDTLFLTCVLEGIVFMRLTQPGILVTSLQHAGEVTLCKCT